MDRKIKIAWISAMVFTFVLLLFGGAKASADLGDYIEGDTPQVVENTAESYGFALSVALDVIQGKKSVSDAYAELVEYSINNGCDNLDLIINGGVIGVDMSPREFVNALTNGIRQGIADGGGQVSSFPVSSTNIGDITITGANGNYLSLYFEDIDLDYGCVHYSKRLNGAYYYADGTYYSGFIPGSYAPSHFCFTSSCFNEIQLYYYSSEDELDRLWHSVKNNPSTNGCDVLYIPLANSTYCNVAYVDRYVYDDGSYNSYIIMGQNIDTAFLNGIADTTQVLPEDTKDVDGLSDDELIILIDNMIDTLKEIDPNTEETNGLLQAILNQLKKLDSDDDNPLLRDILKKLNAISVGSNDSVLKKLDTIIEKLTSIDNNISELVEEDKTNAVAKWKDIIGLFEGYFKIPQLKSSANQISTILFGQRVYEQNEATQTMSVAIIGNGGNVISSVMPELGITYDGVKYPLYNLIYSCDSSELENIKQFISFFLIASFLVGLIRNVPTILQGGSILFPVHWENFTMDTSVRYATYKEDSITKGR